MVYRPYQEKANIRTYNSNRKGWREKSRE